MKGKRWKGKIAALLIAVMAFSAPLAAFGTVYDEDAIMTIEDEDEWTYEKASDSDGDETASGSDATASDSDATASDSDATASDSDADETASGSDADASELVETIDEIKGLIPGNYTEESWEALLAALEKAQAVLADGSATQEEIDAALEELTAALEALVASPSDAEPATDSDATEADTEALTAAIENAGKLSESNYTAESWAVFEAALTDAKAVLADEDATQEEIDAALEALTAAMKALVAATDETEADKTKLDAAIKAAEALDEELAGSWWKYTSASRNAFWTAYYTACYVSIEVDATQEEVDAATADLNAAMEGLLMIYDLNAAITTADSLKEPSSQADAWKALQEALEAAKTVQEKAEAGETTQEEIDAAAAALNEALSKITYSVTVENVDNGYIIAYSYDEIREAERYLPIGETVQIPAGTYISAYIQPYDSYWDTLGEDEEVSGCILVNGEEHGWSMGIEIVEDTVIDGKVDTVTFEGGVDLGDDGYYFEVELDPWRLTSQQIYEGVVEAEFGYDSSEGWTVIDSECENMTYETAWYEGTYEDEDVTELFTYDPETKTVTSTETLSYGYYYLEFRYEQKDADGNVIGEYYSMAYINVRGQRFGLRLGLVTIDGEYDSEGYIPLDLADGSSYAQIENAESKTWGDMSDYYDGVEALMWGYTQDGWQTYDMTEYADDSDLEALYSGSTYYYGGYAIMVSDEDGSVYLGAELNVDNDTTPDTDSGSSSGSGSSSSGHSSHSSSGGGGSSTSVSSGTGSWQQDSTGWWYRYADGSYAKDKWVQISNQWYYFGGDGYACTGWQLLDGAWYYLDAQNCNMQTGWHQDPHDTRWYYLDPNSGKMLVGWQLIDGVYYFFNDIEPEQPTWSYDEETAKWNYTNDNHRPYGSMFVGEMTPDGYMVDEKGIWIP